MKKTLSVLAVAALSLGATTSYAKEVVLKPYADYIESPTISEVLAPGATLINTKSGKVVVYNTNDNPPVEPPFDITQGLIVWNIELANKYKEPIFLEDVSETATDYSAIKITEGDSLVLDFSGNNTSLTLGGPTDAEYMVLMFHSRTASGNDFADWYSTNEVPIIGRFSNGDYKAYVIDDTCDLLSSGATSTYGGLVFFNESVADEVLEAEVDPDTLVPEPEPEPSTPSSPTIPEPTTATLSLLALAGLAARRRRK